MCVDKKKYTNLYSCGERDSDRVGNEKMEVIPVVVKDLKNV